MGTYFHKALQKNNIRAFIILTIVIKIEGQGKKKRKKKKEEVKEALVLCLAYGAKHDYILGFERLRFI